MRIVAFSGPKYCGKDTAAKGLFQINQGLKKNLFRRAPMAEGVKNICREAFGYTDYEIEDPVGKETKTDFFPYIEPRWPMMDIANFLRDKYSGLIWVHRWERVALESNVQITDGEPSGGWACHVMTDLRFPEELEMLKHYGACIIYVHRAEAEDQLKLKRGSGNAMALNVSESHYDLIRENATHTIYNDGTIAQLHGEVLGAVRQHYGFWGEWPAADDIIHKIRTGGTPL
jgi:hypothetical protein